MLWRSRTLRFGGTALPGPLLIPSVSSKGFPVEDGVAESGQALKFAAPDINDALLVSAYDLHHSLLPDSERLLGPDHAHTMYATPQLLVVDSGGYELNRSDFESGEQLRDPYDPRGFTRDEFEVLADRLPKDRELLVVSYDDPHNTERGSYQEQRETAQRFFDARGHLRSDLLLKPEAGAHTIDVARLTPVAKDLRYFDVVGVTEKELGDKLLNSLVTLARLRALLDESGCDSVPIHVFGSLDPLMTTLYFLAGAEIFDGLSWLRYAYLDGVSVHPEALSVLTGNIEDRLDRRNALRWVSNLKELSRLRNRLERWAHEPGDYEQLGPRAEQIRQVHTSMLARLEQKG